MELASKIDHTILKPEATPADISKVTAEAIEYRFAAVCASPCYVSQVVAELRGTGVLTCTVSGFPAGTSKSTVKAIESTVAVKDGAEEVDVVAHLPYLAALNFDAAKAELVEVVKACRAVRKDVTVKVIVESAYLMSLGDDKGEQAISIACRAVRESGADFIKTSTGFHPAGGASVKAVELMRKYGEGIRVKASGGIRDLAAAKAMLAAGADRLGLSASVAIVQSGPIGLTTPQRSGGGVNWTRLTICLVALIAIGCSVTPTTIRPAIATSTQPAQPTVPPIVSRPYLLHLPGIGGMRSIDQSLVRGFIQGGFTGQTEIYDWTEGDPGITALRASDRNQREAKLIADKLLAYHRSEPTSTLYLTCHSGGAGLAVWALEDLPEDVHVQTLIFMSPALSPTYDLTRALRHVAGHAYVFSSLSDTVVLGYGTRVFGTIDGIKTDAAGRLGFTRPPQADPDQYAKLVSFPYNSDWARYHNLGDHVGGMTRAFSTGILSPLLLSGVLPAMPVTPPATAPGNRPDLPQPATLPHLGRGDQ